MWVLLTLICSLNVPCERGKENLRGQSQEGCDAAALSFIVKKEKSDKTRDAGCYKRLVVEQ